MQFCVLNFGFFRLVSEFAKAQLGSPKSRFGSITTIYIVVINAAQPGVGRVQVLDSKKNQTKCRLNGQGDIDHIIVFGVGVPRLGIRL